MYLHIPPLSERHGDILLFLRKFTTLNQKNVSDFTPEAMSVRNSYDYPGKIRELANLIERGVALTTSETLDKHHLPEDLRALQIRVFRRSPEITVSTP